MIFIPISAICLCRYNYLLLSHKHCLSYTFSYTYLWSRNSQYTFHAIQTERDQQKVLVISLKLSPYSVPEGMSEYNAMTAHVSTNFKMRGFQWVRARKIQSHIIQVCWGMIF